jgi:DNA-directed RNA polymerase subunit RPC12/RpoP
MLKTSIFKIQVTCPGCGSLHSLSGVHECETCQQCGKVIPLEEFFHRQIFSAADTVKYMNAFVSGTIEQMGGGQVGQAGAYKMTYSSRTAYCEECFKAAEEKDIMESLNTNQPYNCPACGHKMPVKQADDFIRRFHPKAIGILNDSEGTDYMEKDADEKKSMIVFSCMTCGAGLNLTDDAGRMIKCPYCNNENYLPDAIWSKLHPDKEVDPFFVILDTDGSDMQSSLDYFMTMPVMKVYEKHFVNFIKEYFEDPFINDSFNSWLKVFLSAKPAEQIGHSFNIRSLQNYFYEQFSFGLENQNPRLKLTAASYGISIPFDLQLKLAKDPDESVRLALSKNPDLDKETIKILQNDPSPEIASEAKKRKTGFLKNLFG